jgi:hypothetical protein
LNGSVDEQLQRELAGIAAAVQADMPLEPTGDMEKRLRKAGAVGTLVRVANGDVIYIPVTRYTPRFFTATDGQPDMKFERKSKFHAELEACLDLVRDEKPEAVTPRFFVRQLLEIFRENYPGFAAEDMNAWLGDIVADNTVLDSIMGAFNGIKKGVR